MATFRNIVHLLFYFLLFLQFTKMTTLWKRNDKVTALRSTRGGKEKKEKLRVATLEGVLKNLENTRLPWIDSFP